MVYLNRKHSHQNMVEYYFCKVYTAVLECLHHKFSKNNQEKLPDKVQGHGHIAWNHLPKSPLSVHCRCPFSTPALYQKHWVPHTVASNLQPLIHYSCISTPLVTIFFPSSTLLHGNRKIHNRAVLIAQGFSIHSSGQKESDFQ